MIIKFKIKKQTLSKVQDTNTSNNDTTFYKCKFFFDRQTWNNKELFAVFKNNIGYTQIVPLGHYNDVLSCTLPKRMVSDKYFKLYVYAKDSIKTNTISVTLSKQCNTKTKRKKALDDILSQLKNKIDTIQYEDNQIKCYGNNNLIDTIYIDNVDEALVKEQIQIHFEEFEERIQRQLDKYLTEDSITFQDGIIYIK